MYTTGKQVELLLHVTALILVEWILFQFLFRSPDGLPGPDMMASKQKFILIMVGVAVLWGVPLLFMLRTHATNAAQLPRVCHRDGLLDGRD